MRRTVGVLAGAAAILAVPVPALACGGLIAPNGAVGLVKTSTMAGYVDGVEHYVTQFEFAGAKGEFGSIVPLPGVPTRVVRGGEWTLERQASSRGISLNRASTCLPWVVYLAWIEAASARRGSVFLWPDCAPREQLRGLRVRLSLER